MTKVSGLFIYPIKSLQGIEVIEADVLERGFKNDRRWMLVDLDNQAITQRTHPQLSQIEIHLSDQSIIASFSGQKNLEIPLSLHKGEVVEVTVWDDKVSAFKAEEKINTWISNVVGFPCKLVFMREDFGRAINHMRARNAENVSFADGYPYLVIGQSSLDDLNSRLKSPLPMHRFRPNIVVIGNEPYSEDEWRDFRIGDVNFYGTHPCKRCVFTTINQDTGEKGAEPLKTLAMYRKVGNEVIFGVNAIASSVGKIGVGDPIQFP